MYAFYLGLLCLLLSQQHYAQMVSMNFHFDQRDCYIVARGTRAKQAFISGKFNSQNHMITHTGIGISVDSTFLIFDINPVPSGNAISIGDFSSFINDPGLTYYGIWKLRLSGKQKKTLRKQLKSIIKKPVAFDFSFDLNNGRDSLYCSEFCWRLTNSLGEGFRYQPASVETKELGLQQLLQRDTLEYIPVDYFLTFKKIQLCASGEANIE